MNEVKGVLYKIKNKNNVKNRKKKKRHHLNCPKRSELGLA